MISLDFRARNTILASLPLSYADKIDLYARTFIVIIWEIKFLINVKK